MSLPRLRPAVVLKQTPGPDRSLDLTILCANGADCHVTVEWWQTTTEGIVNAVETAVARLDDAYIDQAGAVASFLADALEPHGPLEGP